MIFGVSQKLWNILVGASLRRDNHMTEAVQTVETISAVVESIVVVGALTSYCLTLKPAWMFDVVKSGNLHKTNSNWAMKPPKQPKIFVVPKMKAQLIPVQ